MSDDLPFRSLSELSRMLARGETSSRAIVEACLARIDALDPHLHAFVDVYRDDALAAADAADRERRARSAPGPLAGLPIALKDLFHIEGRQTTAGSKSWLRPDLRSHGDRRRTPHGRRNDPARQDAHGRIRVRRLGTQPADGRAVESVGQRDAPRRRRLVERLRGRGGGRSVPRGDRLGHRRIDPHPGGALRHHRVEAHLWPREPLRRRAAVRHARLDRSARAHRRGRRAAHRGDVRARSARSGDARRAARRPRSRPCRRGRHSRRAHHRPRAGSLSRVHAARRDSRVSGGDRRRSASWARGSTKRRSRSISTT